jgi:hypothetical protein
MSEVVFTGLDGKNPLGFLAALGALNAVADRADNAISQPRLAWRAAGTYRPVLLDGPDRKALLDLLVTDLQSFAGEPALELRYRKRGEGSEAHDLKPPPEEFVKYLRALVASDGKRSLAFAAALATDVAVDNNGSTKPTALHFTAGQQEFLAMVDALRRGVTRDDLEEALFGPWQYARALPVLQWDNSQARDYALRAGDPSKEKKMGVPGADWLAFRGLPFVRVAPISTRAGVASGAGRDRIGTTGCRGGWKTGFFRWPIWTGFLTRSVVSSLVTSPELFEADPRTLRPRGVPIVFESAIVRTDQGGYGSFSPASVAQCAD